MLVHPSQLKKAQNEIAFLIDSGVGSSEQFSILPGDITAKNLGLSADTLIRLRDEVEYVFHLAAIYDLAVPEDFAYQVNVNGTRHVSEWVTLLPNLKRFVYFSTAYVSGDRPGKILESELSCGQSFKNFYESTKYEAEVIVQNTWDSVPTTIIRPAIVMGNSQTGETVKFDGPYFIMRFMDRFRSLPIPYIGAGIAKLNLVPVDYIVNATYYLSHHTIGEHKVYHLTDPRPYAARQVYRMVCEKLLGKRPSFTLPASLVYSCLSFTPFRRWVRVEKQAIEYFRLKTEYDPSQAVKDLAGSGVNCPDFAEFIQVATEYYKQHRLDADKLIPVK